MTEQNTKQLIHRLKTISNDALMQHLAGNTFCGVIAEAADRLEKLSKGQQEPVAWMCPSKCGCLWRDNRDGTMSLFGPNSKSCKSCETWPLSRMIPLYAASTDQSARIAELEKSESFLKERVDLAIKDRDCYESLSKSRLEGLLGATEANRVSLDRIAELEKQLSDLKAKRQPLDYDEIVKMILDWDDKDEEMDLVEFARAIEKAHGIGGGV